MKYCDIEILTANTRADKWWNNLDKKKDTDEKWSTLRHNGVLFPPEYEPLPSKVKILYNNKPVTLDSKSTDNSFHVTAEEAAVFYAMKLEQDDRLGQEQSDRKKVKDDEKFNENFWKDWKKILGANHVIKNFEDVDFTPIQSYIAKRSEEKKRQKKDMSKEEKEKEKEEKENLKDLYGYAVIDDVKIPLGNYMVQPPGLYNGHGVHPLRGRIKSRIIPKDITINVSKKYVPKCYYKNDPCKWGFVVEDKDVTWIAAWRHPITGESNYVWLKREASEWVCASDIEKFEKARVLGENIDKVRKKYTKDLSSSKKDVRQLATAVYLLDVLAIRPGTEKDESKEAGTLGLTTLKCINIKFLENNKITIDFIGKSSIHFNKTFKVDEIVYENLESLCKGTKKKAELFPDVNATTLNDYLKTLLPNITAKVFRTYKASSILQEELSKNVPKVKDDDYKKKLLYNKVNIEVAKALNHKKLGQKAGSVEKIKNKIEEFKEKKKKSNTPKQKASAQKGIDENKAKLEEAEYNISTSTSKVNYLDPRITVAWCKKGDVPIEKIYNKTQLAKFVWAMETESSWEF
jgi:DNA topoisomerase-1